MIKIFLNEPFNTDDVFEEPHSASKPKFILLETVKNLEEKLNELSSYPENGDSYTLVVLYIVNKLSAQSACQNKSIGKTVTLVGVSVLSVLLITVAVKLAIKFEVSVIKTVLRGATYVR